MATGTQHEFLAGQADQANAAGSNAAAGAPTTPAATAQSSGIVASGTTAAIDGGSTVAATNVSVTALERSRVTALAGGAGFGGTAAVGVGLAIINAATTVNAYVGPGSVITADGAGNLAVSATRDSVISALGVAGAVSGYVAVGGAVAYVTDTSAVTSLLGADFASNGTIAGSQVATPTVRGAGFASVAVTASHQAVLDISVGAAAISLGAGLGAAITVADLATDTTAMIGNSSSIGADNAVGSVTVQATSTQTVSPYASNLPLSVAPRGRPARGGGGGR